MVDQPDNPINPDFPQLNHPATPGTAPPVRKPSRITIISIVSGLSVIVLASTGFLLWTLIPTTEEQVIEACHDNVRDGLKDPFSAVFGEEPVAEIGDRGWMVAGEFHANNSFGAMTPGFYVCDVDAVDGEWVADAEVIE